jgi:hypothetical protein
VGQPLRVEDPPPPRVRPPRDPHPRLRHPPSVVRLSRHATGCPVTRHPSPPAAGRQPRSNDHKRCGSATYAKNTRRARAAPVLPSRSGDGRAASPASPRDPRATRPSTTE